MELIKTNFRDKECKISIDKDMEVERVSGDCDLMEWTELDSYRDYSGYHVSKTFSTPDGLRYRLVIEDEDLSQFDAEWEKEEGDKELHKFVVTLYVVPVSVTEEVAAECLGDSIEMVEEIVGKDPEDYSELVLDIASHGHRVRIWAETVWATMPEQPEVKDLIEEAKKQAEPVPDLIKLYMNRPINRAGWTGWWVMRNAKAYPGQHINTNDAEEEITDCGDCGEERRCQRFDTTEGDRWLCERCLSFWTDCKKCGILMLHSPKGYEGAEWVKIDGKKYCDDCALKIMETDPPRIMKGGTHYSDEELAENILDLAALGRDNIYGDFKVDKIWRLRFDEDPKKMYEHFARHIISKPGDEFFLAIVSKGQFDMDLSLYVNVKKRNDSST